jgi:serine/threonine protein kinase
VKRVGKYELGERLGHGGMGVVFAGRNPSLDQAVAIKVLRADFSVPDAAERFAREARAASRLKHPNIVRIFDFGQDEDQWFIVMERIVGETFEQLIARRAALTVAEKLRLFEQVCSAVGYAHRQGWIHRDLKPGNLMLDNEEQLVKVLDFGLARQVESGLTIQAMVMGSPNYMSPEQVRGATVDQRTDVFSGAAVLYELLTYAKAFPGADSDEAMQAVLQIDPPAPSTIVPSLPRELDGIVERALAKDAGERFEDMEAFRQALRHSSVFPAYESGAATGVKPTVVRPVPASSPTPPQAPSSADRASAASSMRSWAMAAAAGVTVLVVGAALFVVSTRDASRPETATTPPPDNRDRGFQDSRVPNPPNPVDDPPVVTTKPVASLPDKAADSSKAGAETPKPPAAGTDQRDILDLLERLAGAYSRLDAKAVAALMVDAPIDDLTYSFSRYSSYRMSITLTSAPIVDGDRATVDCRRVTQMTSMSGQAQPATDEAVTMELMRGPSGWRLVRAVRH